jgi:hypothetical protein
VLIFNSLPGVVVNNSSLIYFKVYEIYPADLRLEEKLKKVAKRDGNSGEIKKVTKWSKSAMSNPVAIRHMWQQEI